MAESASRLSLPWTFQNLFSLIFKDEFDDEIMSEKKLQAEAKRIRTSLEEKNRTRRTQLKRSLESNAEDFQPTGHEPPISLLRSFVNAGPFLEPEGVPIPEPPRDVQEPRDVRRAPDPRYQVQSGLDIECLLYDPEHLPFGSQE